MEGLRAWIQGHSSATPVAMDRLRVLTLNIWNRGGPWERRLPLIRAGIERLSPDIIGLQEVIAEGGRSQADEIGEGLGYVAAFGAAHDLGNGRLFGNAALSRWPVRRSVVAPLPSGGTGENRSVLLAELDSPHGVVPLFVTHLSWRFDEGVVREAQVATLAGWWRGRRRSMGFRRSWWVISMRSRSRPRFGS